MKRMVLSVAIVLAMLFTGCAINHSDAAISRFFPKGKEQVNLEIHKATGEWIFGHGGLGNVIEYYGFIIPEFPRSRVVIPATEVVVNSTNSRTKDIPPIVGGSITVDPTAHQVTVSLQTERGEFPGNGQYSLAMPSP